MVLGTAGDEYAYDVAVDEAYNIIFTGDTTQGVGGGSDAFLAMINDKCPYDTQISGWLGRGR